MRWQANNGGGWSRWFAWHPVRIGDEWVWWEWVERQFLGGVGDYAVFYRGLQ